MSRKDRQFILTPSRPVGCLNHLCQAEIGWLRLHSKSLQIGLFLSNFSSHGSIGLIGSIDGTDNQFVNIALNKYSLLDPGVATDN